MEAYQGPSSNSSSPATFRLAEAAASAEAGGGTPSLWHALRFGRRGPKADAAAQTAAEGGEAPSVWERVLYGRRGAPPPPPRRRQGEPLLEGVVAPTRGGVRNAEGGLVPGGGVLAVRQLSLSTPDGAASSPRGLVRETS
mmetsp:Transcript_24790/g.83618  ORF Transcript_24790/g.83618 Transcript_24790/m.83618 type:complete len:140 (-) Transcript_24790:917-1336(-)